MEDVQGRLDKRGIALDRVGISRLRYPVDVLECTQEPQRTASTVSLSVDLPAEAKGTHMSRFIGVLHEFQGGLSASTIPSLLEATRHALGAEAASIEFAFPFFLARQAPVSGMVGYLDYECRLAGHANSRSISVSMCAKVPVTSLCPCSKEISDYGAHNQRGYLTVEVQPTIDPRGLPQSIWFEELISIAERCASAPVYSVLKRSDERQVTMQAFENPVFVEDMVRNAVVRLRKDSRVAAARVHAENLESIHNHSAFAEHSWVQDAVNSRSGQPAMRTASVP